MLWPGAVRGGRSIDNGSELLRVSALARSMLTPLLAARDSMSRASAAYQNHRYEILKPGDDLLRGAHGPISAQLRVDHGGRYSAAPNQHDQVLTRSGPQGNELR